MKDEDFAGLVAVVFCSLFGALVSILLFIGFARAHDAPASRKQPYGWSYDISCCNAFDCRQLSADEIEETPTGYIWRSKHSGAVHVYTHDERMSDHGSMRIRRSQDEFYHGCESNQIPARKLCLYVPDKAG